jgi:hypothetical protein
MVDRRKSVERRNFLMSDKDIAEKAGVSPIPSAIGGRPAPFPL